MTANEENENGITLGEPTEAPETKAEETSSVELKEEEIEKPSSDDFEGIRIMSPDEVENMGTSNEEEEESFIEKPAENKPSKGTGKISAEKRAEILKIIGATLKEEGVIADLPEEFDGSIDSLKEVLNSTVETKLTEGLDKYKDNFSGVKKTFLEIEDAFADERTAIKVAQDLEFFNSVSEDQIETDESVAKALYAQSLLSRGFTQDKVEEAIEDAITLGKLESKAIDALPGLKAGAANYVETSRQQKLAAEQARKDAETQTFTQLMDSVENREAIVEGLPFTKVHKDKLKESMSNIAYTDEQGRSYNEIGYKQMQNPKEFEVMMHYYNSLGLFNLDKSGQFKPDLSKLKKVAKTAAAKEVDDIIADTSIRRSNTGSGVGATDEEHTAGILSLLKQGFKQ